MLHCLMCQFVWNEFNTCDASSSIRFCTFFFYTMAAAAGAGAGITDGTLMRVVSIEHARGGLNCCISSNDRAT